MRNDASSEIFVFLHQVIYQYCLDLTVELCFVCILLYFKHSLIISSNFITFSLNLHYTKK